MGAFLSSIFGGSNPTLDKSINNAGEMTGFSQHAGEEGTTDALKFYHSILSGDPSQIGQAIAPETAAAQEGAQQQKQQIGQFGTRSGGTAGATAGIDAATHANLLKLIGGLQTTAAGGAGNIGETSMAQAATTNGQQAQLSQQRMQNWLNSILGKGITQGAGAAVTAGLGRFLPTDGA